MTRDFSNWKDGTLSFKKHEKSSCHREAVEVMITLPATTCNVSELLSKQHAIQKIKNIDALLEIMSSRKYLGRQGLALRGDNEDGNLTQLLLMKAESDPNLKQWLKRKENVYTSPDIQNEAIKLFGMTVLVSEIHCSPFITIMVDETTDVSNREQATLLLSALLLKNSLDSMRFHRLIQKLLLT